MRKKVVLYNPKAVFWTMPLALIAIGSALDPKEFEVVIVDGRLESYEKLQAELKDAICLGITVLTGAPLNDALEVSRKVKSEFQKIPIIWGGWHSSLFPEMCAKEKSVDVAVIGQGETIFRELVKNISENKSLEKIDGICFEKDGQTIKNPAPKVLNINEFPKQNYELIDVPKYYALKNQKQFDYISSQGCRFRCSFCADPAVYNRNWFGLEPERMIEELEFWWKKHRFDDLAFQDETFFTYGKRVEQIAEKILERNLKFTWFGTLRADQGRIIDEKIFELCKKSGLRKVMIGLEAGDKDTLKFIQKDIKIEDMWFTAEKLIKNKIGAIINVILGFPNESEKSIRETLRVAKEMRKMSSDFELSIFYFKPYPGNAIADLLRLQNYKFPKDLEEWAKFDYIGSSNEWIDESLKNEIENFKFYQKFAYNKSINPVRFALKQVSKKRVENNFYNLPFEKKIIETLKPSVKLS
ncbi:MAG: radical SAM protein [Calditrichaeota bacterium]|nr:MAG: radical SAM protein [Calditrichota bacterium]